MRRFLLPMALAVSLLVASCGGSSGAGEEDPAALAAIAEGSSIFSADCALCHGQFGQGTAGPAMDAVVETFPVCTEQIQWTALGSDAWKREVGPTYGATEQPIGSRMPGFSPALTDPEIAVVSAWVRTEYGGESAAAAIAGCGVG